MAFRNPARKALSLIIGAVCTGLAMGEAAAQSDDSVTIYSSLQTGADSPDLYRPEAFLWSGARLRHRAPRPAF